VSEKYVKGDDGFFSHVHIRSETDERLIYDAGQEETNAYRHITQCYARVKKYPFPCIALCGNGQNYKQNQPKIMRHVKVLGITEILVWNDFSPNTTLCTDQG
jgi:hypothetical protein